jgi:hypothetical protein
MLRPETTAVRAQRFLAACREMAEAGTGVRLAVHRVSDGAFIGWCRLKPVEPGLPQRIDGLRLRHGGVGPCLGNRSRPGLAAVGV